jgi:uncharacterized protein YgiB involved in biofilm formation
MRRSRKVDLVFAAASVLAATAALGGCSDEKLDPSKQFPDRAECEAYYGAERCEPNPENQRKAVAMTEQNRPQFASKEQCEAEFGKDQCSQPQTARSGGGGGGLWWLPFFIPGQTYYHPRGSGQTGYFQGRPNAVPPPSQIADASRAYAPTARTVADIRGGRITAPSAGRGGFGSRGSSFGS